MPQIRTVIFDLDDTLLETGELFSEVLGNLCARIRERLGPTAPPPLEIIRRQEEIDIKLLAGQGVTPQRFAESMVETYREFLAGNPAARAEDEAYLRNEGLRAFSDIPELTPDIFAVFDALGDREKIIYTWGAPEIQLPRIKAHELGKHFTAIHCVKEKSPAVLGRVLEQRKPEETIVCGDSLKGEIAPALALGCHAALVVRPNAWSFHHVEVTGHYHRLDKLADLIGVIEGIERS